LSEFANRSIGENSTNPVTLFVSGIPRVARGHFTLMRFPSKRRHFEEIDNFFPRNKKYRNIVGFESLC
jgi:hypothetical protein